MMKKTSIACLMALLGTSVLDTAEAKEIMSYEDQLEDGAEYDDQDQANNDSGDEDEEDDEGDEEEEEGDSLAERDNAPQEAPKPNQSLAQAMAEDSDSESDDEFYTKNQKKPKQPKPPMYTRKFLIRSHMRGNRRLYMSKEQVGEDFIVKIKKDINDWRAWFVYDRRTRTLRIDTKRDLALSNQFNKGMKVGQKVAFRKFVRKAKDQWIRFGPKRIFNKQKKCLTPANMRNGDNNGLMWWKCNGHKSQLWQKLFRVPIPKKKPNWFKDKFIIYSEASQNRRLYMSTEQVGPDHILKVKRGVNNWRAWFIMDKRTNSIRLFERRAMAISNQHNHGNKAGHFAVLRNFLKKDKAQNLKFTGVRIRNRGKKCLTIKDFKNTDMQYVNFWKCKGKKTQQWKRVVAISAKERAAIQKKFEEEYKKGSQKTQDELKEEAFISNKFQLKSGMPENRVLHLTKDKVGAKGLALKVGTSGYGIDDIGMVYDRKTKTIKSSRHRKMVLSAEFANQMVEGKRAIFRPYNPKEKDQQISFVGQTIQNANKQCLSMKDFKNKEGNTVTWRKCEKGKVSQNWVRVQDGQKVVKDGNRAFKADPAKPLFKHEKAETPKSEKKPKRPMVKKDEGKPKVAVTKKKTAGVGGKKKAALMQVFAKPAEENPASLDNQEPTTMADNDDDQFDSPTSAEDKQMKGIFSDSADGDDADEDISDANEEDED